MKVFISWSGSLSERVAKAIHDWLPNVIQSLDVFMSSEDIEKGSRWFSDVSSELDKTDFGIAHLA